MGYGTDYTHWRIHYAHYRKQGKRPDIARLMAKQDQADQVRRYTGTKIWTGLGGSDGQVFVPSWTRDRYRWIEKPFTKGLRFAGYADELNRSIKHTGWYTDEDGFSETVRGVVYHLPGGRAVYGIDNQINGSADKGGPVMLCISESGLVQDREGMTCNSHALYELSDYASWADSAAESYAEAEREYQAAWRAMSEASEKLVDCRLEVLESIASHRSAKEKYELVSMVGTVTHDAYRDAAMCVFSSKDALCSALEEYRMAWREVDLATDKRLGITLNSF